VRNAKPAGAQLCTEASLKHEIEQQHGQPVRDEEMGIATAACRVSSCSGTGDVDGAAFFGADLDVYVTDMVSRRFCKGSPVLVDLNGGGNGKNATDVISSCGL
jgi:hypothetical protein